jgi:hypothetical protein
MSGRGDRGGSGGYGPAGAAARVQRPLASGLVVAGTLLLVIGVVRFLLVLEVFPSEVAAVVADGWPVLIVLTGGWLVATGRRLLGTATAVLGVLMLAPRVLPDGFTVPVLLIVLGLLVLLGAGGGRRWLLGSQGAVALFDDVRSGSDGSPPARSYVAVFGESEGRIDPALAAEGPLECLAVFGDVTVTVPPDVAITVTETAVFGEVRTPPPPSMPPRAVVAVRATAVFGDVRLVRG